MICRDPCELLNKLKRLFFPVFDVYVDAKLTTQQNIQNIKMKTKHSVMEHSRKVQDLANKLRAAGHQTSVLDKKQALFRGLRTEFGITAEVIRSSGIDYNTAVSNSIIRKSGEPEIIFAKDEALSKKVNRQSDFNCHKDKKIYHCGKMSHIAADCFRNYKSRNYKKNNRKKKHLEPGTLNVMERTLLDHQNQFLRVTKKRALLSKNGYKTLPAQVL